jgi:hypothetical protein
VSFVHKQNPSHGTCTRPYVFIIQEQMCQEPRTETSVTCRFHLQTSLWVSRSEDKQKLHPLDDFVKLEEDPHNATNAAMRLAYCDSQFVKEERGSGTCRYACEAQPRPPQAQIAANKQEIALLPSLLPLVQFIHEEGPTQLHRFNRARARCLEGHLSEDLQKEHPDTDARQ